jgi:exopolysaccharide biosynthesis polyprenyl glycosylphosphotransferase
VTHAQQMAPPFTDTARVLAAVPAPTSTWAEVYRRRLLVTDLAAILVAVTAAQVVRFGVGNDPLLANTSLVSYSLVSTILGGAWMLALVLFRAREPRVVGIGVEEYRRVAHASLGLFGTVAIVAFLFKLDPARGYLAVALPLGILLLLVGRRLWRGWLARQRATGRCYSNVLVVGSHRAAIAMAKRFERDTRAGFRVVGVCEPGWGSANKVLDIGGHRVPVLGDEHSVLEAVARSGADTVAVSNTEFLGADGMRALAWELEASRTNLVVSSGVVDVAGTRLQVRPVAGLPLLHIDKPQYKAAGQLHKLVFDIVGAAGVLLVLSPLMVAVAVAVAVTSRGPVFYKAERIGLNGKPFAMLKFRSMVADANTKLAGLLEAQGTADTPLFKIENDPRITRVGKFIRRYSIDEIPQLINVLKGDMSLVGPRPQVAKEVALYDRAAARRLFVKPGMTGLWQVSGRSNLGWEDSVRLDLFYVENWSLLDDIAILARTVRAVLGSDGAV